MKRFDPAKLIKALREDKVHAVPQGWLTTKEVVPMLGLKTMSGARLPLERMIRAGFVEHRKLSSVRFIFRLSPKFRSWADAHAKAIELEKPVAPEGWVSLAAYARKNRRTVRGIQYRIDDAGIDFKVFRIPRPCRHYRVTDLDRLLRKAS